MYKFNESFFEEIDTPEKAYWLGFISADGGINIPGFGRETGHVLCINLKQDDSTHLDALQQALCRKGPIYHTCVAGHRVSRLQIGSAKMVQDLISHGVSPRKSLSLKPWDGSIELMRHYWRGLVDGDGYIGKSIKRTVQGRIYPAWRISLVGTKDVLESFRQFVSEIGGPPGYLGPHGRAFLISWQGMNAPAKICESLYVDANIFLKRKWLAAKELLSYHAERNIIKRGDLPSEETV